MHKRVRNKAFFTITLILAILILSPSYVTGQSSLGDKINITVMADKEPLRGATLVIKRTNPPIGTTTDFNGVAELTIPTGFQKVEISLLGPYVVLDIIRPSDSIYFDISSKYAIFYLGGKRMKRKKQTVGRY
jgi:hypothetical protein